MVLVQKDFFQLTELTNFERPPKPSTSIFTVGPVDEYLGKDAALQFWKVWQHSAHDVAHCGLGRASKTNGRMSWR